VSLYGLLAPSPDFNPGDDAEVCVLKGVVRYQKKWLDSIAEGGDRVESLLSAITETGKAGSKLASYTFQSYQHHAGKMFPGPGITTSRSRTNQRIQSYTRGALKLSCH
jgi:hypothetical protein